MGGGGKIEYALLLPRTNPPVDYLHISGTNTQPSFPKHVWSPAGGWYAQPTNWKANTAVMGAVVFGIAAMAFSISADREHRDKMPEQGRFFPSRKYETLRLLRTGSHGLLLPSLTSHLQLEPRD